MSETNNGQNTLSVFEYTCPTCNSKLRLSYLKMVCFFTTNVCIQYGSLVISALQMHSFEF